MLTQHHIALQYTLWEDGDKSNISINDAFLQYLNQFALRNRNEVDIYNVVTMLRDDVHDLYELFKTIVDGFDLGIFFSNGQPNIPISSLLQWRQICSHLDPDSILCFSFIDNKHTLNALSQLPNWKTIAPIYCKELFSVLQSLGVSDLHIHFEGSTPPGRNWLYYMNGLAYTNNSHIVSAKHRRSAIHQRLLKHCETYHSIHINNVNKNTPLNTFLHNERALLIAAWQILSSHDLSASLQSDLFHYIYYKSKYFQEHTQFPGSNPGLRTFKKYFKKNKSFKTGGTETNSRKIADHIAFLQEYPWMYYIEPRISPFCHVTEYQRYFNDIEKGFRTLLKENNKPYSGKFGFCIHFQRKQQGKQDSIPYEKLRSLIDKQSALLHYIRCHRSELASRIVAVDVADEEKNTPPCIFTPYLRLLRHGNLRKEFNYYSKQFTEHHKTILPSKHFSKHCYKWKLVQPGSSPLRFPRLKITYHSGEDYYHPIDGMRFMDEVIEFAGLTSDDCLGHGLAAGDDINSFHKRCINGIYMPLEIHLDNLVWIHKKLTTNNDKLFIKEINFINNRVIKLANCVHNKRVTIDMLYDIPFFLHRIPPDFEPDHRTINNETFKLYLDRLFCSSSKKNLENTIEVFSDYDLLNKNGALNYIQNNFLLELAAKQILVEFNPSSNLATGYCGDLTKHAIFKYLEIQNESTIATINTDDPGVFYTRIDIEYALIYNAMLDNGFDKTRALKYLTIIRDNSLHIPRLASEHKLDSSETH